MTTHTDAVHLVAAAVRALAAVQAGNPSHPHVDAFHALLNGHPDTAGVARALAVQAAKHLRGDELNVPTELVDDTAADDGRLLAGRLNQIGQLLDDDTERAAYADTVERTLAAAVRWATDVSSPRAHLISAAPSLLLSWASTTAATPAMATALSEAARAFAAAWGVQAQVAAFREQLDTPRGP